MMKWYVWVLIALLVVHVIGMIVAYVDFCRTHQPEPFMDGIDVFLYGVMIFFWEFTLIGFVRDGRFSQQTEQKKPNHIY